MAVIRLRSLDDLRTVLKTVIHGSRRAYICVTDEVAQLWLVPKVTSRHRHYYYLESVEEEISKGIEEVSKYGIPIIKGSVNNIGAS